MTPEQQQEMQKFLQQYFDFSNYGSQERPDYVPVSNQQTINPSDIDFTSGFEQGEEAGWESFFDRMNSWLYPVSDSVSKAIGAGITGKNPFDVGRGGYFGDPRPLVSEALEARGVPGPLAFVAEFLVPDPIGAKKVKDLIPLLGLLLPFKQAFSPGSNFNVAVNKIKNLFGDEAADTLGNFAIWAAENDSAIVRRARYREPAEEMAAIMGISFDDALKMVSEEMMDEAAASIIETLMGYGMQRSEAFDVINDLIMTNAPKREKQLTVLRSQIPNRQVARNIFDDYNVVNALASYTGESTWAALGPWDTMKPAFARSTTRIKTPAISNAGLKKLIASDSIGVGEGEYLYQTLNRNLREGDNALRNKLSDSDYNAFMSYVNTIDSAFNGSYVTDRPVGLWRGVVSPNRPVNSVNELIGMSWIENGYSSFTEDTNSAFNFLRTKKFAPLQAENQPMIVQMLLPPGSPAVPMTGISNMPSEFEVLLPRNTQFKVVNAVDRGNYWLVLVEPDFSLNPAAQTR